MRFRSNPGAHIANAKAHAQFAYIIGVSLATVQMLRSDEHQFAFRHHHCFIIVKLIFLPAVQSQVHFKIGVRMRQ